MSENILMSQWVASYTFKPHVMVEGWLLSGSSKAVLIMLVHKLVNDNAEKESVNHEINITKCAWSQHKIESI